MSLPDVPTVIETNRTVAERRAGFDRHLVDGSKHYRDEWPSMASAAPPFAVDGPDDDDDDDPESTPLLEATLGGES